ncbi:MAG: hypothetical protein GY856_01115 [bacterium]|nr:hypothetical protein [bacterium]
MESALAFDTHAYVRKLRDVGVPEPQAEVQVAAIAALIEDRMATKQDLNAQDAALKRDIKELETALRRDIKELETALRRDIKELETAVKRDLKELEMRLTIRLGGLLAVGIALIATLIKLL